MYVQTPPLDGLRSIRRNLQIFWLKDLTTKTDGIDQELTAFSAQTAFD